MIGEEVAVFWQKEAGGSSRR